MATHSETKELYGIKQNGEMCFSAKELEFLAEDEMIEIIPRFSFQEIGLLSGSVGPFQPMVPVQVPLWLALKLHERQMCKIQLPSWLHRDELLERKREEEAEKENKYLTPVEFHYQEIATILFRRAPDSFAGQEGNSRIQVKDIEELRDSKIHTSLRDLEQYTPAVKIANVSAMEINKIRPFLVQALNRFRTLKEAEDQFGESSQTVIDSQDAGL
mmetsp:Transcript_32092/g.72091  ORF Transcript_32092/g.72091 Transcript_32092/m.72091 type:complete len:215 (-) Transcript_32092:79-723(-)